MARFKVIESEGLSIWKNFDHQSGIDVKGKLLFRVESHVFAGAEIVQIPMTKADLFLRIFEAIPGTLKLFQTLFNVKTLWKRRRNGSNTLWKPGK